MKGVIEVKNLSEPLFVLDDISKFETSLFRTVYEKAGVLLGNIISKKQEEIEKREKTDVRSTVENIISFQGRRGTGKTSAMLSVHDALKKYNNREDHQHFLGFSEKNREVSFVVIDYINASMLEKGEDILELVLANMFSLLRKRESEERERISYSNRKLYQLFEEIYGNLINIKKRREENGDISPLRMLTKLSNSQVMETRICELVKEYLDYMQRDRNGYGNGRNAFLVITIDDVDMHFQKEGSSPYEMLETLHRYLMIPGVIIMLSYNYLDLYQGCEKHFYELFHKSQKMGDKEESYVQELALQYLNKILPAHMKVNMPSLRKRDYEGNGMPKVRLTKSEAETILKEFAQEFQFSGENPVINLSVKEFALLLKASVAGLYYDARGNKRHFSEPLRLRELAQTYIFYRQLEVMDEERKREERDEAIYKELLDDLYFRFATEKLLKKEMEKFRRYLDVTIERRSRDIVSDIKKCANDKGVAFSEIEYKGLEDVSYSYGELLYGLYKASSEGWFSKELIWCILDSYTIMLTKLYKKFISKNEEQQKKEIKERLMEIIGASISSSWSNVFLPKYRLFNEEGRESHTGEARESKKGIIKFGALKFTSMDSVSDSVSWNFELKGIRSTETCRQALQTMEILGMFFTNVKKNGDEGFQITYEPVKKGEVNALPEEMYKPYFRFCFTDGCFNIMNRHRGNPYFFP